MWVAIGFLAGVLALFALMYNSLVSKRNMAENAFATTDTLLKKRYDLIPNLVATVKGYAQHEAGVFAEVTRLRVEVQSGNLSTDEAVQAHNEIGAALRRIIAVVEDYPELKASENFQLLQRTLTELEEQISAGRRAYNAAVTELNNAVEMFPTNFVASMTGFRRRKLFQTEDDEREVPRVGEL